MKKKFKLLFFVFVLRTKFFTRGDVKKLFEEAIRRGAPKWDAGDKEWCTNLYRRTIGLVHACIHGAELEAALDKCARQRSVDDRGRILRNAMDAFLNNDGFNDDAIVMVEL